VDDVVVTCGRCPKNVEIGYASLTIRRRRREERHVLHTPSTSLCRGSHPHCAATRPSLHIVNRHCDDDEEYLLLFSFIRSRDEVHV
jgi:hypothetical protein